MFEELDDPQLTDGAHYGPAETHRISRVRSAVRRRRRRRVVARSTVAVFASVALIALGLTWRWNRSFDRIQTVEIATDPPPAFDAPLNILVVGWDQPFRDVPVGEQQRAAADLIRLVRVTPGEVPLVVPLPRDLRVKASDGQYRQINSAAIRASDLDEALTTLVNDIESLGLPVDHALAVDAVGAESILYAIGPQRFRVDAPEEVQTITDDYTGLSLSRVEGDFDCGPRSPNELIKWARTRHVRTNTTRDQRGDPGRIVRTTSIGDGIMADLFSALDTPVEVDRILTAAADHMQRDEDLTARRLWEIFRNVERATPTTAYIATVDAVGPQGAAYLAPAATAVNTEIWKQLGSATGPTDAVQPTPGEPLHSPGTQQFAFIDC